MSTAHSNPIALALLDRDRHLSAPSDSATAQCASFRRKGTTLARKNDASSKFGPRIETSEGKMAIDGAMPIKLFACWQFGYS